MRTNNNECRNLIAIELRDYIYTYIYVYSLMKHTHAKGQKPGEEQ